jgi:hypothetical protein
MTGQAAPRAALRINALNRYAIRNIASRLNAPPGLVVAALALGLYLLTLAPDLTWAHFSADGGELMTAAVTLGIPHPPGYPTYVVLGHIFSRLPLGSIALRFNLFSALAMAAAAGLSAAAALRLLPQPAPRRRLAAGAAGLTFAVAPLAWGQATVTEVYALNAAVVAALVWALLSKRPSLLNGLLLGLSLTTHLTSLLLTPAALALTPRRQWGRLGLGALLGLSPLLLLPLLARGSSPVIWGDPTTLRGWWWLVSGALYHPNLSVPTGAARLATLQELAGWLGPQLGWIGWPVAALGIYGVLAGATGDARQRAASSVRAPGFWLPATAVAYALTSLAYRTDDAELYFLPGLLLLALFLAPGWGRYGRWAPLLPLSLILLNFGSQNISQDGAVRAGAEQVLHAAPQEAILLTPGDRSIFTLWFLHHVEEQRPDLALVDANLLAFDWYRERLQAQQPGLRALDRDDLDYFLETNRRQRPLCTLTLLEPANMHCHEVNP